MTAGPSIAERSRFACRSLLFCPASQERRVARALDSDADGVIIDLEDAVAVDSKESARALLTELPFDSNGGKAIFVRVNGIDTPWIWADLRAACRAGIHGVVLPKAESDLDLVRVDGALMLGESDVGLAARSIGVVPLIETAAGVMNASALCRAPRARTVIFGSGEQGDLIADLEAEWTPEGTGLNTARALVLLAARAAGMANPLDGVFMAFNDDDALRRECELARRMGYVGKALIHPRQIAVAHDVFTPSVEVVAAQRRIIEAFEAAEASGQAAVNLDGQMLDYAVVRRARAIVARANERGGSNT